MQGRIKPNREHRASMTGKLLLFAAAALVAGCGASDLSSIRMNVMEDGSGSMLVVCTRVQPGPDDPVRRESEGVRWQKPKGVVVVQKADFDNIAGLSFAGIKFAPSSAEDGSKALAVTIPLGAETKWVKLLAPSDADRKFVREVSRGHTDVPNIGGEPSFLLTLSVPEEIRQARLDPDILPKDTGGMGGLFSSSAEMRFRGKRARLLLPLSVIARRKGELTWRVSYGKGKTRGRPRAKTPSPTTGKATTGAEVQEPEKVKTPVSGETPGKKAAPAEPAKAE